MTVVLVPIVAHYGVDAVFAVSIMAGIMIVLAGVLRLGRYLEYMPWPVFEGFTVGIAIIIFLQQVPNALGVEKPEGERTAVVAAKAVRDAVDHGSPAALLTVVLVAAIMVGVVRLRAGLPGSLDRRSGRDSHRRGHAPRHRPDRLTAELAAGAVPPFDLDFRRCRR